jgi:hypothetical protein
MRILAIGVFVALITIGGYGVYSAVVCPMHTGGTDAKAASLRAADPGKATGSFDATMSGVCRFSCAAQQPYEAKDVVPQPGAVAGRLTRCPVSGVVFEVDDQRPRVALASGEYVLCCDRCAEKLKKDPARFVRG